MAKKYVPLALKIPLDIVGPSEENLLWDIPTAARKMSSTVWAVRQLIWSKQLVPIRLGKKFLLDPADLRAFIQRQKAVAA